MNIKVGIVEDNSDIRQALEQIIQMSSGMELVCSCENGEDALVKLPMVKMRWLNYPFTNPKLC